MDCTFDLTIEGGEEKNYAHKNCEKINPNLFHNIEGIYVLKKFEDIGRLPEYVKINVKSCRRFLEIFYLDKTLPKLNSRETLALCDIRLECLNKITSIDYNKFVIKKLIDKVSETNSNGKKTKKKILDYGIGSGISLDCLRSSELNDKYELIGTDISKEALRICTHLGINTFHWHNGKYIPPEYFDAIISSFVFDFNITLHEIKRLYSLLKEGGRLALNLYKDDLCNYNYVTTNLRNAEFDIKEEEIKVPREQFGIKHKIEKVIIASKL
ncbi:MAG: class I SAM-dependent methyltransferase [Candidatus Hodarchaeota archaeon]